MLLPNYYSQDKTTYNLDGETGISDNGIIPYTATIGVRMNADGTVDKNEHGVYTQIGSATDYIIPNSADKTNIRFRCTSTGTTLDAGSSSTGSWVSAPCEWYIQESTAGDYTLNLSIELSKDAGSSTHDTGVYQGSASVLFPE